MDGSWKNSQDLAGPRLIKLPTSVGDRENSCTIDVQRSKNRGAHDWHKY
jgi:hypothetical protein